MPRLHSQRFALAACALTALLVWSVPARADFDNVYSAGHADINIDYNGTVLTMDYEFGSNAVINGLVIGAGGAGPRPANTITTLVGLNSLTTGPAGLPAPFAGNPLWVLPQNSVPGRPFLGIGAEEVNPGVFQNDMITMTLTAFVQRPLGGEFVLWQAGQEGSPLMNSANGISAADSVQVGAGGHDHFNYGFSRAGVYDISFAVRAVLASNGQTVNGAGTYRFNVVPEPGTITLMGLGLGSVGLFTVRRLRRGRMESGQATLN